MKKILFPHYTGLAKLASRTFGWDHTDLAQIFVEARKARITIPNLSTPYGNSQIEGVLNPLLSLVYRAVDSEGLITFIRMPRTSLPREVQLALQTEVLNESQIKEICPQEDILIKPGKYFAPFLAQNLINMTPRDPAVMEMLGRKSHQDFCVANYGFERLLSPDKPLDFSEYAREFARKPVT